MSNADRMRGGLLRLGALSAYDKALEAFGVEPGPVLAEWGLGPEQFEDVDALISIRDAAAMLERGAELTRCRHFPLELASRQSWSLLGTLGLLLQTAKNVREALQDSERYLTSTHAGPIRWVLRRHGKLDAYVFNLEYGDLKPQQLELVTELALSQCFRVAQTIAGNRPIIERVCFRHRGPLDILRYRQFFRAPVEVTADFDGILFAPGALDTPILHTDPQMHALIQRFMDRQSLPDADSSIADEVRAFIRHLLPTGQCNIERIARCYACDKRTLQRYLRDEGQTSYQELLDEVRFDLATRYLKGSEIPMDRLAKTVGFRDASNFARAFKGRYGVSPSTWRKQNRDPSPSRRVVLRPL